MWLLDFPVATLPLWQEMQVPTTSPCSSLSTRFHELVLWQLLQLSDVFMCCELRLSPVERDDTEWQATQRVGVPLKTPPM
jgi:hypothetical protein